MGSATFGMRIMAIELRHESGHLLDFITSVLHTIGLHVCFAFVLVQLLSIGMMVMRDDRKSLTDMVIGTFMVNRAQIRYKRRAWIRTGALPSDPSLVRLSLCAIPCP